MKLDGEGEVVDFVITIGSIFGLVVPAVTGRCFIFKQCFTYKHVLFINVVIQVK